MAKDMTLLWGSGSPPCWRIMITLEEKELKDCQCKLLSFEKMEHKSKEVMDMNPRGQLPAFKCGDHPLNESFAACMFLESQYKSKGTKLTPDSPSELALMYQRMFEGFTLAQKSGMVIYYDYIVPAAERHDSAIKRNRESLSAEVKLWEGYLEEQTKGDYLAGSSFTMADVCIFPNISYLFNYGLCEKRYPKLAAYHNRLRTRPSIKATWPPTWLNKPQSSDVLKDI